MSGEAEGRIPTLAEVLAGAGDAANRPISLDGLGIVYPGGLTLLYGLPKSGKSTLAAALAATAGEGLFTEALHRGWRVSVLRDWIERREAEAAEGAGR